MNRQEGQSASSLTWPPSDEVVASTCDREPSIQRAETELRGFASRCLGLLLRDDDYQTLVGALYHRCETSCRHAL